jgi:hypothetical protein
MQMPWLQIFADSVQARPDRPLLMTLATVDQTAGVDARMVVCREVDRNGSVWFTSDSRSAKNEQLQRNPNAAAVIWLVHCRRQFRFRGLVETVESDADRVKIWRQLSDATKAGFFWPAPGALRGSGAFDNPNDLSDPPATFTVLRLRPIVVELLELDPAPHRRRRWQAANAWQLEELNP